MRTSRLRGIAAALAALVLPVTVVSAATPTIAITSVGGQTVSAGKVDRPLSGTVEVRGTASLDGESGGGGESARPLVADAGDSPFVETGEAATLLGAGFGGAEPYTFAWTSAAGVLAGADAPTAQLDTTGLAAGRYTVSLKVTDSAGATANDSVIVVVYRATDQTLLDQTKTDLMPGTSLGNPNLQTFLEFPFDVPAGTRSFEVEVTWTNPANDYDLHLIDPAGAERDYSGNGATNLILALETASGSNPAPGRWNIKLDRYLTATDTVRAVVAGKMAPDPRPAVDAGGPYRFQSGAAQALDGTVTGGAAPVTTAWDLDGDGRFESPGADVTATLPTGRSLVSLKATDASGLERRETTSVLVADLATARRGHHADHRHRDRRHRRSTRTTSSSRRRRIRIRTSSRSRTASPATRRVHPRLPGRRPGPRRHPRAGLLPAARTSTLWTRAEASTKATLYWIPGTKIIGAW